MQVTTGREELERLAHSRAEERAERNARRAVQALFIMGIFSIGVNFILYAGYGILLFTRIDFRDWGPSIVGVIMMITGVLLYPHFKKDYYQKEYKLELARLELSQTASSADSA